MPVFVYVPPRVMPPPKFLPVHQCKFCGTTGTGDKCKKCGGKLGFF